jgi:hypothetical protein
MSIRIGKHLRGKLFISRFQAEIDIRHRVFIKTECHNLALILPDSVLIGVGNVHPIGKR